MGGWFKKEINELEDFRGLKMRIPGLGGEVVRGLGGAAVTLAGSELFQALQSGAIDATEWVGPWNDHAFGLHQIAPFYYGPGFHEPGRIMMSAISSRSNRGSSGPYPSTSSQMLVIDPPFQALYRGVPYSCRRNLCRRRGTER